MTPEREVAPERSGERIPHRGLKDYAPLTVPPGARIDGFMTTRDSHGRLYDWVRVGRNERIVGRLECDVVPEILAAPASSDLDIPPRHGLSKELTAWWSKFSSKDPWGLLLGPIVKAVEDAGYRIWTVGGTVRDMLYGIDTDKVTDLDLTGTMPMATFRALVEEVYRQHRPSEWPEKLYIANPGCVIHLRRLPGDRDPFLQYQPLQRGLATDELARPWIFGSDVEVDSLCRDVSVNKLLLDMTEMAIIDPAEGLDDLGINRTCLKALEQGLVVAIRPTITGGLTLPDERPIQNLARFLKAVLHLNPYSDETPVGVDMTRTRDAFATWWESNGAAIDSLANDDSARLWTPWLRKCLSRKDGVVRSPEEIGKVWADLVLPYELWSFIERQLKKLRDTQALTVRGDSGPSAAAVMSGRDLHYVIQLPSGTFALGHSLAEPDLVSWGEARRVFGDILSDSMHVTLELEMEDGRVAASGFRHQDGQLFVEVDANGAPVPA